MRRLAVALFLACLPLPASGQELISQCIAPEDQLMAAITEVHDKQRNIGLQVAIRVDDQLVFSRALGLADVERDIPVNRATRFPIASLTKAFTGIAALKASERGFDLDAPIQITVP